MMFIMKRWTVSVQGYGTGEYDAASRGKAFAAAWRCDAFGHLHFRDFLKIARCHRSLAIAPFGDPITVDDRPAFYLGATNSSVTFCYPDSAVSHCAHPYEVEPESYRPSNYHTPSTKSKGIDDVG